MRRFEPAVYGHDAADLETKALEKAREVFGLEVGLTIDRSYTIHENYEYKSKREYDATSEYQNELAYKYPYHASIAIHPVEPVTGHEWVPPTKATMKESWPSLFHTGGLTGGLTSGL